MAKVIPDAKLQQSDELKNKSVNGVIKNIFAK